MKVRLNFWVILVFMLASCGSTGKVKQTPKVTGQLLLTPEQQRKYNYFFLEAIRLKEKKEYDAAFDLLKHCQTINPQGASALYEIAQYYLFLKQIPQGQTALEAAVENAPDNYWYNQALASLYQGQNKKEESIQFLEKMVIRFPEKRETLFALLDLYNQKQDYEKVIATLNRLEAKVGKNEQLAMEKFRIYLQMKDDKKALLEIESLVGEYPMDARYQVILGDVYMQNGKKNEAYEIYQKVLAADPNHVMALFSLASYYEEMGRTDLYQQQIDSLLLKKQVPAENKLDVMRQMIAQNEQADGDSTRIIALFDRIMALDLEDSQMPMLYVQYLWAKNMKKASEPIIERVMQLDPTNKAIRLMWLQLAIEENDFQRVIRICEPGIEATPDGIEFYFYLALAYNQAERSDDVLKVCRKALQYVTDGTEKKIVSDLYSIMGDVYHGKALTTECFNAYDSALIYNPINVGTLNNYAYYLSVEQSDLDKAEEMSYKTIKAEPTNSTYLDTYAWILFQKGNYEQARIYIDEAVKNDDTKSDVIIEHCGDIYYMVGELDGAMMFWQQALEKGSQSKTLKEKIKKKKYIAE